MCKEAAVYKLESLSRKLPGRTERNLTAAVRKVDYGPKFKYGTSRRAHTKQECSPLNKISPSF